ncbi:hypothetical protein OG923_23825 [Streptomyces halstedii]|uniref:hypothetical protein n=1 Tax=Streptomyces halstedii TaxID=1944 RepID=UPI0032567484
MVPTLGWAGRHHRVDGDIWWPRGDMQRAAAAYEAARNEAAQHGVAGERALSQAQRAFALAFTDPDVAHDEIDLAEQLLTGLDLRATTFTVKMAALVRDAGTGRDVPGRAEVLRAEIRASGLVAPETMLELAAAFHHAVVNDANAAAATIARLHRLTSSGSYAYYTDIAHHMANTENYILSAARWIDDEATVHHRWRALTTTKRSRLHRR